LRALNARSILLGAVVAGAVVPAAAWAQAPPVDGGTDISASVPSYLELIVSKPGTSLKTFPKARTYSTSFVAVVTATDAPTQLTLADGDASSGSALGHMSSGAKRLPLPLEAKAGKGAFQPLDAAADPLLARWNDVVTRQATTVRLRQKVRSRAAGSYHKLILATASAETP
jgi:hypothetical protein